MPRNKNFSVYTPFICSHCSSIFNAFTKNINILSHKINLSENQPIEPSLSNHKTPFQLQSEFFITVNVITEYSTSDKNFVGTDFSLLKLLRYNGKH